MVPASCGGTTGSDITLLAKEAAMRPLRRLLAALEPSVYSDSSAASPAAALTGAGAGAAAAPRHVLELGPVTADDVAAALSVTKPSAQGYEQQYADFSSKFGQAG